MTPAEIAGQLENITSAEDFATPSSELVDHWNSINVGSEAIEPILLFMEQHPSIEFGTPGALVHFVEKFYRNGYEVKLLESISRRPTQHTAWMLNRMINGTKVPAEKQRLVAVMANAKLNPLADANALNHINLFLEKLGM